MRSCSHAGTSTSGRTPSVLDSVPRRRHVQCIAHSSSSSSGGGTNSSRRSGGGGGGGLRGDKGMRKARADGLYEVKVITPPPRSLGIHALPPNTHNGEEIEIEGAGYVVTSTMHAFKLMRGKYVRDHSCLDVQPTGRFFLNLMLDQLIKGENPGSAA